MHITKITYEGGLEVTNISSDQSNRISLLLFSKPKAESTPAKPTKTAVKKRVGYRAPRWTSSELETLKSHYGKEKAGKIGKMLHRSTGSVQQKAFELGLKRNRREKILDHFGFSQEYKEQASNQYQSA